MGTACNGEHTWCACEWQDLPEFDRGQEQRIYFKTFSVGSRSATPIDMWEDHEARFWEDLKKMRASGWVVYIRHSTPVPISQNVPPHPPPVNRSGSPAPH